MNVYFYNNTKRHNSTALPPTYTEMRDCKFKQPTSLLEPVLIVAFNTKPYYNYFSIDNRYYWITDITSLKEDLWQISGKVDVLATYRRHIQNTQAFVLYDSTTNTEIPDNRLGIKTTPTIQSNTGVMPWSFASGNGTYFVAIEGDGDLVDRGMADGATGIYITDMASIQKIGLDFDGSDVWDSLNTAMTTPFPANIKLQTTWGNINSSKDVFDAIEDSLNGGDVAGVIGYGLIGWMLLPWTFWTGIIGTIKGLITGADALKHVKSAYWLPFEFTGTGIQKNKIAIGSYIDQIGTSKRISDPIKDTYAAVSIPWQYSDWRNVQNTEIQVYIPLIGVVKIPASAVRGQTVITIKCSINLFSGQFSVRLECGGVELGTFGANAMMPILIGDSNPDIPAITNTVVAGAALAAGAATGTAALTAGAAGAFIQSGLSSIEPLSTTVGGIGGGCGNSLGTSIECTTICHNTSQTPSSLLSVIGTPTNKLKQLNGSGYCQTMNAQMNNALAGELTSHTILNQVVATFNTNTAQPYSDLIVDINAIQEGEGTPAPDNVRPIIGFANTRIDNNGIITTIDHGAAGTVYGGYLNVLTGVLTVTYKGIDLGDLTWQISSGTFYAQNAVTDRKTGAKAICSIFNQNPTEVAPSALTTNYNFAFQSNVIGRLSIRDNDYNDPNLFKTAVSGVKFYYELATPLTYNLSGVSLGSNVGANRISSLTNGNVNTLTYYTVSTPEADPTETEILLVNSALDAGVYLE